MKFVTSFSPHRIERQQYCLSTWMAMGLPVTAVQTAGEIVSLQEFFPQVSSWVETPLGQDQSVGKRCCPSLHELIWQAKSEPIILINADISTKDKPKQFRKTWDVTAENEGTLLVCARKDYDEVGGRKDLNPYGLDAFRITPSMIEILPDRGWRIGYPGWDYWLAIEAYQAGHDVRRVDSSLLHPRHSGGYSQQDIALATAKLSVDHRIPAQAITHYVQALTGRYGMRKRK
jgi:hypothetical protein